MSHYFDSNQASASDRRTVEVMLHDVAFSYETDRGVFSHGELDSGTAVLLQEAPPPPSHGVLVDLGCGAGPIALTLGLRSPEAHIVAVDTNDRARQLTAANARRVNVGITTMHPDEVPDALRVDLIWSNPPIRIGKTALHDMLQVWLDRLTEHGEAYLVVQRHLGADSLHDWLTQHGWKVTRVSSRKGFRLLHVQR